jgi:hypothetical protein
MMLDDLMEFALLHVDQCDYVLQTLSGPNGFNEGDTFYTDYLNTGLPDGYHLLVNNAKHTTPAQVEERNIPAMSGRAL